MKCNRDCFNCIFEDCIDTSVEISEFEKAEKERLQAKKKLEQREHKKEYMRRYYREHKASYNSQMAKWREAHPNYNKEYWQKQKELKKVN